MIGAVFETVAPVILCAATGYGWRRLGQPYDVKLVTRLVSLIGAPCLIFSTLVSTTGMAPAMGTMLGAAAAALACFAVLSFLFLRIARLPVRTYLAALVFPNAGNMGLPLCLFAFGQPGLALGIGYFAVTATLNLTLGAWFYAGTASPLRALRTPIPYAVGLGLILMATNVAVPEVILKATSLLGGLAIPLMLLSLGVSLAELGVRQPGRMIGLSLVRFGMGLGVGVGLAALFGLEGPARGVLIIQSAMPVAVFNYLFSSYYDRQPEAIASLVVISSLLGFLSLPFLVYLAL
jgi:hypothetical protein